MDFTKLPDNLPRPMDDGSCDHLLGMTIPRTVFPSTKGNFIDVISLVGDKTISNYINNTTRIPIDFPIAQSLEELV